MNNLDAFEDQAAVGATKPEIVLNGNIDVHITRSIGTVVQITLRILVEDIGGGRADLVVQCEDGKYRLDAARATQ